MYQLIVVEDQHLDESYSVIDVIYARKREYSVLRNVWFDFAMLCVDNVEPANEEISVTR